MSNRQQGIVRKFYPDFGYGFIKGDDSSHVFFHIKQCREYVRKGDLVAYSVVRSKKYEGRPSAHDVQLLKHRGRDS